MSAHAESESFIVVDQIKEIAEGISDVVTQAISLFVFGMLAIFDANPIVQAH